MTTNEAIYLDSLRYELARSIEWLADLLSGKNLTYADDYEAWRSAVGSGLSTITMLVELIDVMPMVFSRQRRKRSGCRERLEPSTGRTHFVRCFGLPMTIRLQSL